LDRLAHGSRPGDRLPRLSATTCIACAPSSRASRWCATAGRTPATPAPRHQEAGAHRRRRRQALRRTQGRYRGIGWNYAHVAVDDATRLAYVEELADERAETAAAFLERALAFFEGHGICVQRLLTDNGSCYRSHLFAAAAQQHGLTLWHTQPYRPQTNGKAEAFVKIVQNGWLTGDLRLDRGTDRRPATLPSLLQWLPTAWRPGR